MDLLSRSPVSFTHPYFLLLLLALPLFGYYARRHKRVPRGPWPLALWLRLTVAALLVLALAGLRVPAPARSVAAVFVVDQSASVPVDIREAARHWVRQALAAQGPDDVAGIVVFDREARVELPLGKHRDHAAWAEYTGGAAPDTAPALERSEGTDVAAALELAAGLLPHPQSGPLRRLVLLTDGNETLGDAQRALERPPLRDVEVAVLALPGRLQDAGIVGLTVPPALREGEPAEIRVAVLSPAAGEATLKVWARGGSMEHLIFDGRVELEHGPKEVVVNAGDLPQGTWAFRALLEPANDSRPENNESWAYTIVQEPARVLLVEGAPGEAAAVHAALARAKIRVDSLRPQQLPRQLEPLLAYEAIVLANVHGSELRRDQMTLLQRFVAERGRGLVVIGGDRTFGLGEYQDTPLEELLPVTVQPPDRDQVASLALLLVIDRSGSMSALDTLDRRASRMDLAKEGAILAVETLKEGDQVGVIAFDYTPRWAADFRTIRGPGDTRAVADRIAVIQPDGGTDIFAALELAHRGLQQVSARVKHIILLTDGESSPAGFPSLMNAMRRAGITVSAVGVSAPENGVRLLQDVTRRGQGRLYTTNSASDVPRIMTQEARLAGKSFKQERDFKPRLAAAAPAVRGLVPAEFPLLHGYVRVTPKPGSETVLTSDQEEVVLSQWQFGLGRSLVWTPDAQGEWAKDWAAAPQFQQLWPQAVRWTMPAPVAPGLSISIRGDGETATIRVEAFEANGEFRSLLQTYADVALPDGSGKRVPLPQVAPGRYEGRLALAGPGVYFLRVSQLADDGEVMAAQTTGYALPHLPEYQLLAPNRALLERLAATTGGPTVSQPLEAWRRDTRRASQPQDVWSYLLMAALAFFVVDVAARRLRFAVDDWLAVRAAARRLARAPWRQWRLPRPTLHPVQSGRR